MLIYKLEVDSNIRHLQERNTVGEDYRESCEDSGKKLKMIEEGERVTDKRSEIEWMGEREGRESERE